ncbi:type II toxin-antitoxin system RelE family toxin [Dolichospermum compactum]|uniref:Putative plasmid stabilization system protein n=1 Tax=Dolichospermum compactum NIES-806 TaxID=1973481 RepID=A0A1Z4V7M2_9CYAN|nr:type II toxin-antitoxin system RelE/ParE family toxin [Dolichospermum compactum]BAZ87403.1 putative plasmid stabilization system protein [Dolichospermum compactum NIES-806]
MEYQIVLKPCAARDVSKLAQAFKEAVGVVIDSLKKNPRPLGVKKLYHNQDLYRVRVKDHRIVYQIDDKSHEVLIVIIGLRNRVYRRI